MSQLGAVLLVLFRRRTHAAGVTLIAAALALSAVVATSPPAGATVGDDKAQIAKIAHQIEVQGDHVQDLVTRSNAVETHLGQIDVRIAHNQTVLDADQRAETAATATLRATAIRAYVTDGGVSDLTVFTDTTDITSALEQTHYLGAVNDKFTRQLGTLLAAQADTKAAQKALQSDRDAAQATLAQLTSARTAATTAIAVEERSLTNVKGNLKQLMAAATAQHEKEEAAEERALAKAVHASTPQVDAPTPAVLSAVPTTSPTSTAAPTAPPPAPSGPAPSPGTYANPLRASVGLTPERIDQGVDYSGFGPLYAIGDGVVLTTVGGGWPGGTFIAYQLTDGPARGLVVYDAEDIQPTVNVGDRVNSNTVLGQMFAGPNGIEIGWANGSRLPDTMARDSGQFNGDNSTAFGANFSQLLQSLGAPGGILQNNPATGSLPSGWPQW